MDTAERRDCLCRQIGGVRFGNVRAAIMPAVKFAKEGEAVVLAVEDSLEYGRLSGKRQALLPSDATPSTCDNILAGWSSAGSFLPRHVPVVVDFHDAKYSTCVRANDG